MMLESVKPGTATCMACQRKDLMAEFACQDRSQCWEQCGELGKSEEHAVEVADYLSQPMKA